MACCGIDYGGHVTQPARLSLPLICKPHTNRLAQRTMRLHCFRKQSGRKPRKSSPFLWLEPTQLISAITHCTSVRKHARIRKKEVLTFVHCVENRQLQTVFIPMKSYLMVSRMEEKMLMHHCKHSVARRCPNQHSGAARMLMGLLMMLGNKRVCHPSSICLRSIVLAVQLKCRVRKCHWK